MKTRLLLSLTLTLTISLLPLHTHAHTWTTNPFTYNTQFRTKDCRGAECTNACPTILLPHLMKNTVHRPARVYRRGSVVPITWAKNNHHGGLVRISLVPVTQMHDRRAHRKFTLMHGCWQSGEYSCRAAGDSCGTDRAGKAFKRWIRIPETFPDGNYVLGWVWYGGLHFTRHTGQFPDFYSCAFVKVQGGAPVGGPYKAKWMAGWGPGVVDGKCLTSASAVGECQFGCRWKRSYRDIASVFKWGGGPKPFYTWDVKQAFKVGLGDKSEVFGLCKNNVCCPRSCGGCGGDRCHKMPGGGDNCCLGAIIKRKRPCDKFSPPCVRHL